MTLVFDKGYSDKGDFDMCSYRCHGRAEASDYQISAVEQELAGYHGQQRVLDLEM